jgi:hypothetical protein
VLAIVELHRRLKLFADLVLPLIGVVFLASFTLGGDAFALRVMQVVMVGGASASLWVRARLEAHPRVETLDLLVFGFACAVTLNSAFYYWGVLSGVLVLMPLGAFVFPVGQSRPGLLAALAVLLSHFALASLTITGVLSDRGLIRPINITPVGQWLSLLFADAIAVARPRDARGRPAR